MDEKIAIDLERDALEVLTARAEAHGRDVAEEVRSIVLASIAPSKPQMDWVARSREIRAMTPPRSIRVDSWKLIRASLDWDH